MARWFIARHGETVFNAAGRMQGAAPHTPLTRAGFAQADAMGEALRARLGPRPKLDLWASDTGRALQTLAVIAEHLELDWHQARTDARLAEIDVGAWSGLYYRDVAAAVGPIIDPSTMLFSVRPPGGEWYDGIAARLQGWIDDTASEEGDRLILMHGVSSRVLRGLLTRAEPRPECGAPVADGLPQGSLVEIAGGRERVLAPGVGADTY
ncbi:MAG TPA: histidine phosphatase family protein [Allosphingosinicella sp.]|nr:histidine phosphatase family protein [Allosphingosinicella sp.]